MKQHRIGFVAVALALIGCEADGTPEQQAVRSHLRANLDSPEFEEIQWWPAEPLKGAELWTGGETFIRTYNAWGKVEHESGSAVRLKYRAKTAAGATAIHDRMFFIVDGKVLETVEPIDFRPAGMTDEQYIARFEHDPQFGERIRRDMARAGGQRGIQSVLKGISGVEDGEREPLSSPQ